MKTTNTVNIATLKAKLAEHLRRVKKGESITILDHKMPVARIIPYEVELPNTLTTIKASGSFADVAKLKVPASEKPIDSLKYLMEERGKR